MAHNLLTANIVHQLLFFDYKELHHSDDNETEETLRDKPTFIFAMQDHAIVTIDYYSTEEKLIKASSETKRFTSIAAFNETKLLIGCEASAILLWDVNQWSCNKVVDKNFHQSRPIIGIKALNDSYQRVISIGDNGSICVWDGSKIDGTAFKLLQAMHENIGVMSYDIDTNCLVGVYGQNAKEIVVWNINSKKKQTFDKPASTLTHIRFFSRQILISAGSNIIFAKTHDSYKDAVNILVELKDIDPNLTNVIGFATNNTLLILATQTKIFKLDFTKLFLPKTLCFPQYTTTMDFDTIKSCLSDQGIIIKESSKDLGKSTKKKFFYTISNNNLYCTTYSIEQKKDQRFFANKIISNIPSAIPNKISSINSLIPSYDGHYFAIHSTNIIGVWSLKLSPIFTIENIFMETCLSLAWHSNSKMYHSIFNIGSPYFVLKKKLATLGSKSSVRIKRQVLS